MNNKITTLLALLLCCTVCVVRSQQRPTAKPTVGVQAKAPTSPVEASAELDVYGALCGLKNAKGENVWGKDTPMAYDGYSIAYRVGRTVAQGETQIVSAIKERVTTDQLVPIQSDKEANTTQAAVRTKDGALQITSLVRVHSQLGILVVAREVKNISPQPVSLLALEVHTDARLSRYNGPEQRRLKSRGLKNGVTAILIQPLGGPPPDCMTCICEIMKCPGCCPEAAAAPAEGCVEYFEGGNSAAAFSIRNCRAPCLFKPELCQTSKRRIVSYWSPGGRLPIVLPPGKTILLQMGYYLR